MNVMKHVLRAVAGVALAVALPLSASAQGLIRDAEIEGILREYFNPIFEAAGLKASDVDLYIVQDDSLNAMTAGGQNIFINTGLIIKAPSPEALKGVIAHETGHIVLGHNVTRPQAMGAAQGTSLITLGLGVLAMAAGAPDAAMGLFGSAQQFGMMTFFKFTRVEEAAADQKGLDLLAATNQSADGLADFMQQFVYEELMQGREPDPYFRSHPISSDRLSAVRRRAAEVDAHAQPQSQRDIDDMAMMKAKLVGFIGPPSRVMSRYPASDQSIPAKYARAIAAYRAVDIKAALKGVDELISLKPDDPYFYELKGQILFENGKSVESVEPHRKSVELAPDKALLKVNLARSLIATKKTEYQDEAEGLLIDATTLEKDNAFAWRELAELYGAQNRIGEADFATAEEAYNLGDMARAHNFANRALTKLKPDTPYGQRAKDIVLMSDPRMRGGRGGRAGLAFHTQQ